jgi:MscS family membrane protein
VRTSLEKMREYLRERPDVFPDTILVHLTTFGDSALVIEVNTWLVGREWNQFLTWREETMLGLMDIVESCGSAFAFPTQTVHVEMTPVPTPSAGVSPPNPAV